MKKTLAANIDENHTYLGVKLFPKFSYQIPGSNGKKLCFAMQNIHDNSCDDSSWVTSNVKRAYEFLKDKEPKSSGLIGIASYETSFGQKKIVITFSGKKPQLDTKVSTELEIELQKEVDEDVLIIIPAAQKLSDLYTGYRKNRFQDINSLERFLKEKKPLSKRRKYTKKLLEKIFLNHIKNTDTLKQEGYAPGQVGFHTESNQAMNLFVQNIAMVLLNTKHKHKSYLEDVIKNPEIIRDDKYELLHDEFKEKFVQAMQFQYKPFFEKNKFNEELQTLKEELKGDRKRLFLFLEKLEKMMNIQFEENYTNEDIWIELQKQFKRSEEIIQEILGAINNSNLDKNLRERIWDIAIQMDNCMGFKYFNINLVDYLSSCAEDQFLTFVQRNKKIKEEIKHAKTHTMFHAIYKSGDETLCPCIKCQMHMPQNLNEVFQV